MGSSAAVLAGGTDLLVNMKNKSESPERLVALSQVDELKELGGKGSLSIGTGVSAAGGAATFTISQLTKKIAVRGK